ncbi:hypothetical protein DFH06DRAFT_1211076 [Mycena polygramma]|nr:hypothetical protein DFH06DRAFT_1211076 [Mycena polygramma]
MIPRQQTLGWLPSNLRKILFNRSRLRIRIICTAIFLIVFLSLTSISVIRLRPPIEYADAQQRATDIPTPPPVIPPPIITAPVTESVGASLYHPFVPPVPAAYLANQIVRPIRAHGDISDDCLDKWVSKGQWDDPCGEGMVQDAIVDLVYVWVNGSDPLHVKARGELLAALNYTTADARFREHDELRYSLRAAHVATKSWPRNRWHIITADVPHPNPNMTDHAGRLGLVPQWLNIQCAFHNPSHQPSIHLHHDTDIFRLTGRPGTRLTFVDAIDWLRKVIPSFNSHAIESQLPQLNPEIVADSIVALNDDQFLMMPIPPSAFHSTLYGPVFRMQPHLRVGGDASGNADGGGEWRSLGWSSHLMSQRFGLRKRPYTQHNARALSVPLMHEMSLTFGSYFAATPLSQFRGSHNAQEELEVNTIFMATHFVIERHREALLWSWIVGKWGGRPGMLSRDQKKRMWRELGGREGDKLNLNKATRSTMGDLEFNMWMAGVQPPRSPKPQVGTTSYSWVSMDGYSDSYARLAQSTVMSRSECIGNEMERAWDMFLRVVKDNLACGDAVIAALMHASTSGLSVFLPEPSIQPPSEADPIILPLEMSAKPPPFPQNPRAFAVRLLMRYAYAIGESPMNFIGPTTAIETSNLLRGADRRSDVLFGINDDWKDGEVAAADKVLRDWFQRRWPNKLQCEV